MTKKSETNQESTEKKRPPGRPKSENARTTWLPVRVSQAEIEILRDRSAQEGIGMTAYVRRRLKLESTGYGEVLMSRESGSS